MCPCMLYGTVNCYQELCENLVFVTVPDDHRDKWQGQYGHIWNSMGNSEKPFVVSEGFTFFGVGCSRDQNGLVLLNTSEDVVYIKKGQVLGEFYYGCAYGGGVP